MKAFGRSEYVGGIEIAGKNSSAYSIAVWSCEENDTFEHITGRTVVRHELTRLVRRQETGHRLSSNAAIVPSSGLSDRSHPWTHPPSLFPPPSLFIGPVARHRSLHRRTRIRSTAARLNKLPIHPRQGAPSSKRRIVETPSSKPRRLEIKRRV